MPAFNSWTLNVFLNFSADGTDDARLRIKAIGSTPEIRNIGDGSGDLPDSSDVDGAGLDNGINRLLAAAAAAAAANGGTAPSAVAPDSTTTAAAGAIPSVSSSSNATSLSDALVAAMAAATPLSIGAVAAATSSSSTNNGKPSHGSMFTSPSIVFSAVYFVVYFLAFVSVLFRLTLTYVFHFSSPSTFPFRISFHFDTILQQLKVRFHF